MAYGDTQLKLLFGLYFIFSGIVYGAYNPFFSDNEPARKTSKPTSLLLLPPPLNLHQSPIMTEPRISAVSAQIYYFGFIESDKGKFALLKVNGKNIVLKENNRVYINSLPYLVREISSNAVVMENNEKQIKLVYFSGEMDDKK